MHTDSRHPPLLEQQYLGRSLGTDRDDKCPRVVIIIRKVWKTPNGVNNEEVLRQCLSHFNTHTIHLKTMPAPSQGACFSASQTGFWVMPILLVHIPSFEKQGCRQ